MIDPTRSRRTARPRDPASAPTSDGRTAGLPDRQARGDERERAQQREALQLAHRIVELASDKKASDIVLLSVGESTTLTDYFVICSGGSERQLGAISDGIVESLKADGLLPIGKEGATSAHWLLLDYGSVIVHIMAWPERDFYALEKLWADAPLLVRVQ